MSTFVRENSYRTSVSEQFRFLENPDEIIVVSDGWPVCDDEQGCVNENVQVQ